DDGWDEELVAQANKEQTEPDLEPSYESIGAEAEFSSLIYDGSQFNTAALDADEDADLLGIPGLLHADQVKDLVRKKPVEAMDARAAKEREERAAQAAEEHRRKIHGLPSAPANRRAGQQQSEEDGESPVAIDEVTNLRKELNTIVSITAGRTGRPHGAIHTEARKACGGPPTALCNADQLRERIEYLRKW